MKQMENRFDEPTQLSSTLLVAAPEYCCGNTEKYNYLPEVTVVTPLGYVDNVRIVLLNCESRSAIKDCLETLIEEIDGMTNQEQEDVTNTKCIFLKLLELLKDNHVAPIYRELRSKAEQLISPFSTDDRMIYLCENKRMQSLD